jgi:hypothetical protein
LAPEKSSLNSSPKKVEKSTSKAPQKRKWLSIPKKMTENIYFLFY